VTERAFSSFLFHLFLPFELRALAKVSVPDSIAVVPRDFRMPKNAANSQFKIKLQKRFHAFGVAF